MFTLKKRKTKQVCLLFIPLLYCSVVSAQSQNGITGTVKNDKGEVLAGATVKVLKTKTVILTDSSGNFTVNVKYLDNEFEISHIGYKTKIVKGDEINNIILSAQNSSLDDVVVVGYNTQSRRKVTAAVSSLSGDAIQDIPQLSFDQMLQGRLAGVNVLQSSGEPGAATKIVIRGSTNVDYGNANGGNTQPLYVIDGVIYDVNNMGTSYTYSNPLSVIDPNDIESIDVLKDASAAAIYGARGGNGVIIVKTRRAKSYKPQVTLNAYGGGTLNPKLIDVTTGNAERALKLKMLNSQLTYTDLQNGVIPIQLTDSLNSSFNNDVDWQGLLIENFAKVNSEELSLQGMFPGNNMYRFGISHYDEQGAVNGYGVSRIAPNLDLQLNPISKLSVGLTMQISSEKHTHGAGVSDNPYIFSPSNFPTSLAALSQSQLDLYSGKSSRYDDDKVFSMAGSLRLTDTLTKDLTITSTFGYNNFQEKYAYFSPEALNGIYNEANDITNSNPNWTWESYAQYNKHIGLNNLTLVGGYSAYKAMKYDATMYAYGIDVSNIYTVATVPSGSNLYANSTTATKTTQSYYGRVNYDYNGKYLFTGSLRRDASSIYSPDYRWGTFYSASLGWVMSDENFFQPLKHVVNFLKLRASYGVTGQDPGSWYAKYQSLYTDASSYGSTTGIIGGGAAYPYLTGTPSTYNGTTVVTPFPYVDNYVNSGIKSSNDVRWEKYPQLDFGMDWEMFNSRLSFSMDWYQKDADDKYLWQIPAESTTGYAYYSGNYVNVRNTGLELSVTSHNLKNTSAFQWITNFNISFDKNWVTKLPNGGRDIIYGAPWFRKTLTLGQPLFSYKIWKVDGVYATDQSVPTDPITGSKMTYFGTTLKGGDPKYVDQNGDYNINYDDQVNMNASPAPKVTGGLTNTFNYKGFSLTVFAMYSFGNKLLNGTLSDALNGSSYAAWGSVAGPAGVYSQYLNKFWQQSGDANATYPRLVYGTGSTQLDPWNVANSYFLRDGSYIRLQQIMLGYTFTSGLVRKWHLSALNVYGSFNNIYTWKKSKDLVDPSLYDNTTGSSNATYPNALKVNLGFRVTL
ncbi:SusC/RagA family TonB-linked outer membrane protein [Rhizosphaericola mali]|uniref:SusC/RagA family TonB-linked outer membrane protein n=1 Tax=Rhizosphaericola mali TaxID=2545455 RepID=A0A5P2G010_9BACT|nr:SusC/RagA family TonB-linked outer membrane protein [Rhizosphaericola mali]QES89124.1 SusC/RagA family TonB-linked outer membrane protein [Rhizosphaericola mali]